MTDLIGSLADQLDWHWRHQARPRLEGLTDEEYLWEPVEYAWSVRRRDVPAPEWATMRAGSGEWLIDFAFPEPEPAPVTTIAWRLGHLIVGVLGARVHSHFGGPEADYLSWDYSGTAAGAVHQLDEAYARWVAGVRSLTEESLIRPVGPAEHDFAALPMRDLVLHINREMIHHLAEIALLRDLWANRDR
jgi:hypothetical protein